LLFRRFVKPVVDTLLAAAGILLLTPIFCALFVAIRIGMGNPVIFRQVRIGLDDKPFVFLKFRSMSDACDSRGDLLPDAERIGRFGAFLRSTSLDELPQLWNVLRGDMSLIGPRPLLPEYLPRYSAEQRRRHEVKPGITGLAQVKGRNTLSWDEKFRLDVEYVDQCSASLDLAVLWKTLYSVVRRDGISRDGHATMPTFEG
jgi:lipopolysaccharide/colanic/teichoic acid biosynthesis glycosyltransferase